MDAVIEAEATEDTEDFDEPQASEVAAAEVDTVEEGEDEVTEAVEEAIDAADSESLDEGLSGTPEADTPPRRRQLEAEESQGSMTRWTRSRSSATAAKPSRAEADTQRPRRPTVHYVEAQQAARLSREAPLPVESTSGSAKQWYVIHTYSGYENKVKANLEHRIESMGVEDQIFQVLVPMEEEIEIKNGQRQTVNKKVFPGYVLVEMAMSDESWYVVRNTPGVTSFVGSGNRPTPLVEAEVKKILKQMGSRRRSSSSSSPGGSERPRQGWPVRRVHRHGGRGQPGEEQGQGAGQHLRPRDAGGARLPADRQALAFEPMAA